MRPCGRTVEEGLKSAWGAWGRLLGISRVLGALSTGKSLSGRSYLAERCPHAKGRCQDSRRNIF